MATIPMDLATHVATNVADTLVTKATKELEYLRHYNNYVDDFEKKKESLIAKRGTLHKDIQDARGRNEDEIEDDVKLWLERANRLIDEVTEGKKKWYRLVTNCFHHYEQGKALAQKTLEIEELMSSTFNRVARSTGLPGIEFYSSANFMHLKDRKLKFEDLKEALSGYNKFMIGLYGLGGTGKTTLAIEVGKEVKNSGVFDKVIFNVVSKDPNLKQIRDNIAKHLNLTLDGENDTEQSEKLWKYIQNGEKKVLIVLDDAWEKFALQDIGIPIGRHGKGCCAILLTTRYGKVCRDMECDETIDLKVLNEKDAIDLFLKYAGKSIDDSSDDFKDVAKDIVKECGRLPVAIVTVASALKSSPLREWKQALERLNNPKSIHDVEEDLKAAYNSLKLSYDRLKNEEARKLFLLCSLFPEDCEIPIEILSRISIGLGLCGEASRYSVARSHFTPIINELMDSCLLLKARSGAVKMHDLVREVALWIGNKQVQVATNSNITLMDNIQYSSWNIASFPNHFDGSKLEVLLLWISNTTVRVPDGIFKGMTSLKILALMSKENIKISADSLLQSHVSWINVQSLALKGFELGDISILAKLKTLESLELRKCSMTELPKEIGDLEKLRLLEVVQCVIERNNPFEVIGICLQLEELYFVLNEMIESETQITTLPNKLEKYQIKGWHRNCSYEVDFSMSRYFDSKSLTVNFSDEVFKSLVSGAEVLKLHGDNYNKGWTNIVPDILPIEDNNMKGHLTRLCLKCMNGINCLIPTEHLQSGVAIFSSLIKLKLFKCSMASLFHPFTAHSLKHLEEMHITGCSQLKYIVAETMEDHDPNQKSQNDSIFPKLNNLLITSCPVLEFVFPICFCKDLPLLESMKIGDCEKLEYIFGQYQEERDLHQIRKEAVLHSLEVLEIKNVPNFINIYAECYLPLPCSNEVQKSSPNSNVEYGSSDLSRSCLCCFWPKSNASSQHHPSASMNNNQASKVKYVVNRAHALLTPPLYLYSLLRTLEISKLVGLKSLFTLSIASSLKLLQILKVEGWDTLEHIVTNEEHGDDHMNVNYSIFPKLQKVFMFDCSHLEYVFPAFYSTDFKDLKVMRIKKAERLRHVFGKCQADQNHNVQADLNLPSLERLHLIDLPNMVSICAENYSMKEVYLEGIGLEGCPKLCLGTLIDLLVVGKKQQEDLSRRKELSLEFKELKSSHKSFQNLSRLLLRGCKELKFIFSASASRILQSLISLHVSECEELESIIEDEENNKNHMAPHQIWFPKLREIDVRNCKSLKSLFSIPMGKIPRLLAVSIRDAPQLREVFGWKHGDEHKLVAQEVFPKLNAIRLQNLPTLCTICHGIDFQTVKLLMMRDCPAIPLTPASYSSEELYELAASLRRNSVLGGEDFGYLLVKIMFWADEIEEGQEDVGNNSTMPQQKNGLPNFENGEEVLKEITGEDSTTTSNLPNLTEDNVVYKANSSTPSEVTISDQGKSASIKELCEKESKGDKEEFGEIISLHKGPTINDLSTKEATDKVALQLSTTSTGMASGLELFGKESMVDQPELGESGCSNNNETPKKIEDPTSEGYSNETSNKVSLKIPTPPVTEMSSTLSSSISSPKKPHIASLAAQKEMEPGSSKYDPFTISAVTDQSAQIEEEGQEDVGNNSTMPQQNNNGSPNFENSTGEDSTTNSNLPNLAEDNVVHKASSSTRSEVTISNKGSSAGSIKELHGKESVVNQQELGEIGCSNNGNEAPQRVENPANEGYSKETSNEVSLKISPPLVTEMSSGLSSSSISSPKKPHIATSATHKEMEPGSLQSDPSTVSAITVQSAPQDKIMSQSETLIVKEVKLDQGNHQQFAEDDLMRLFHIMEEGAEMEVHMPHVSKIAAFEDNNVLSKALADLEATLKMNLNEMACSEESMLRLKNAFNILSTHCSEDGASSTHGLQATIHSLQQEIQNVVSSSKQAYATIDTFNRLEQKEKLLDEERSKRKEAAIALLSQIHNKEGSLSEARLKEAELEKKISKLQAELRSKEKEIKECEMELLCLKEEKEKSVSETMRFIKEFDAVKKEKSHIVEENIKAKQQLQNMDTKWSSCLFNLKKTTVLLGVHLQQKR